MPPDLAPSHVSSRWFSGSCMSGGPGFVETPKRAAARGEPWNEAAFAPSEPASPRDRAMGPAVENYGMERDGPWPSLPGLLLIAGGAGPRAGVQLQDKILKNTITDGSDQDHLDCFHVSCGSRISDRTCFLQHGEGQNPGEQMGHIVSEACKLSDGRRKVIVGVPCVTFHAEPICSVFRSFLQGYDNGDARAQTTASCPLAHAPFARPLARGAACPTPLALCRLSRGHQSESCVQPRPKRPGTRCASLRG